MPEIDDSQNIDFPINYRVLTQAPPGEDSSEGDV
jgi:hypothetical protein